MNNNLISPGLVRSRVGIVPVDLGVSDALTAGNVGGSFDWQTAVTSLLNAGVYIYVAQQQANAARDAYNRSMAEGRNIYQTGYNPSSSESITKYLPYVAVGLIALILVLKK